ncbi:hypothetical protein [Gimesia aquarii]|uniref:Uncharacterized protein n=1 Tax=Gimesia aquarii TaxID=2527964 RepID=A0A517VZY4_9PLAN|nr:hypothetical protein [Gimesia aquarii]QDT98559.1 hypothetical protein V144x_40660 [Gimesia aquarii]
MQYYVQNKLEVPPRIYPAILLLLEAFQYSEQTDADCWEFAVELDDLTGLALTRNDFRWLVKQGLVEHRREVTLEGDDGRAFRVTGDLTFSDRTCFILTEEGVSIARELYQVMASNNSVSYSSTNDSGSGSKTEDVHMLARNGVLRKSMQCLPKWDAERRLLSVNGIIVKHFKWTAMNQEAILTTFEEEGWPARIYDPLPPKLEQDTKRRLSDTIKCLNRKQKNRLIHFRGDGTGEAVTWEFVGQNG